MLLEAVFEPLDFGACPGQYGDELSGIAGDVGEILFGTELGVGDVEEIGRCPKVAQGVPGLDVGRVIGGIAVEQGIVDGDMTIGGDRKGQDELLEIGPMVFVVAMGQASGASSGDFGGSICVLS